MKKIKLKRGKYAIVDDDDYKYLNRFNWVTNNNTVFREFGVDRKTIVIPMWKFVIMTQNNKKVLYKNGNQLDNRKCNLVLISISEKNHFENKKKRGYLGGKPTSKYKGVSFSRTYQGRKKWVADIKKNDKRYKKKFLTEREAGIWYNKKARELYGKYAYQNKIK
ncbi:MAG: hypothetical protein EOL88_00605 [Bacteroidia bacterium]|nr:hypothetical protein [Bacteroidia bacterium]